MKKIYNFINKNTRYVFNIPLAIFILILVAVPIFSIIKYSFYKWQMISFKPPEFIGWGNYIKILSDSRFLNSVGRTLYYAFLALIFEIIIGFIAALIFNKDFKGKNIYRTVFCIPMVMMPVAASLAWILLFNTEFGILNYFLTTLGLGPVGWISSESNALYSLIIVDIWKWTSFVAIILLSGLQSFPQEPFESAKIDGATYFQTIRYITIPLLKPHFITVVILRGIMALKTFDIILTMTGGGPNYATETLNLYLYKNAFEYTKIGYSSTLAIMFLIIVIFFIIILTKWRERSWSY